MTELPNPYGAMSKCTTVRDLFIVFRDDVPAWEAERKERTDGRGATGADRKRWSDYKPIFMAVQNFIADGKSEEEAVTAV